MSGINKLTGLLILSAIFAPLNAFADEATAGKRFSEAKLNEPMLIAFLKGMPKGADLHNHISGAVYDESMLDAAAQSNLYADMTTGAFTASSGAVSVIPASALTKDTALMRKFFDTASMRGAYPGISGHDLFFDSFGKFGPALALIDYSKRLAEVIKRAKWQNIQYLEVMARVEPLGALEKARADFAIQDDNWEQDLKTMSQRFPALVSASKAYLDKLDDVAAEQSGARSTTDGQPVKTRYIFAADRTEPSPARFFSEIACGMAIMQNDKRVVALNILAPEDDYYARKNFDTQMKIIDFLWQRMGRPNITLHAGELTLEYSPVETMRSRIRKSIELGHARRIGHGVSIAWEDNLPELLSKMRKEGIAVEICLSSNEGILKVSGDRHPLPLYRAAKVPFTLNTDDEGVNRSNLTMEFVKAARTFDLSYKEIKDIARNSLEYAFLPGESLYLDRDYGQLRPEFAAVRKSQWQPDNAAKNLMNSHEKLMEQVALERAFVQFEAAYN